MAPRSTGDDVKQATKFVTAASAFATFRSSESACEVEFPDAATVVAAIESLQRSVAEWCEATLTTLSKAVESDAVPATLTRDPAILQRPELQIQLLENPGKATLSASVRALREQLANMALLHKAGIPMSKGATSAGEEVKRHGMVAIALEYGPGEDCGGAGAAGSVVACRAQGAGGGP